MVAWHRTRRADLGLRAIGLLLCSVAYYALKRLEALHVPVHAPTVLAFCLAAAGFFGGSIGAMVVTLGRHLFDPVAVSARWR